MKLGTIRLGATTRCVLVRGEALVELDQPDVGTLLATGEAWRSASPRRGAAEHGRQTAIWAPVVTSPGKIICLGQNYRAHIEEMGRQMPTHPTLFAKFTQALIGARDAIALPVVSQKPDWEAELGLVIGRRVRRETPEQCHDAIAGYTVVNDVTMRDWQSRTPQWLQGKTFEATTPVGPLLVTPDEVDDARDLRISCQLDETVMQDSTTADMLFKPAAIVSYISMVITLDPGDLVSTGTPSGVGDARTPPLYLRPGQQLRSVIEGVGELDNACISDVDASVASAFSGTGPQS